MRKGRRIKERAGTRRKKIEEGTRIRTRRGVTGSEAVQAALHQASHPVSLQVTHHPTPQEADLEMVRKKIRKRKSQNLRVTVTPTNIGMIMTEVEKGVLKGEMIEETKDAMKNEMTMSPRKKRSLKPGIMAMAWPS